MVSQYGLYVVFCIVLLEQLGAPIPAIPVLVIAGALAVNGDLNVLSVFAAALAGCLLGDGAWYVAGRLRGHRVLRLLCQLSLSPDSCVRGTESLFTRWGVGTLVVAKFIPGLSTIAPPLAGAIRLGPTTFIVFDGIGAVVWSAAAIAAGWIFHAEIDAVLTWMGRMGGYAAIIVTSLLAVYLGWRLWERYRFLANLRAARIAVSELYDLITGGHEPVVLDVRTPLARAADARSIPSAVAVHPDMPDEHLARIPRDREIIVYCS
jgi:membrane protein DedA with SNARE-associated domain